MAQLSYRPEVDGLRCIAVLAVVLAHAGVPGIEKGFVGVDVFFVISGYLITALLDREWQGTGRLDFAAFYARRVRRLMPALAIAMLATLLASMVVLSPANGGPQGVSRSVIASLLFTANLHFEEQTSSYFASRSAELPLLHLWSLAVEEQFYFVWPLLLSGLFRLKRSWLVAAVAFLLVVSFGVCELMLRSHPTSAFYQMPARFWELAVGGLVALRPAARWNETRTRWLAGIALLLTLSATVFATPGDHFPGAGALPAVLGAALLIAAIHSGLPLGITGKLLASRPFVLVGRVSYSFYLWHWPLLALDSATGLRASNLTTRLLLCAAAFGLAVLSYRYVETPFRLGWPQLGSRRVLGYGFANSLLLATVAAGIGYRAKQEGAVDTLVTRAGRDKAGPERCIFDIHDDVHALPPADCRSAPAQEPCVVLWGDSHAFALKPLAWEMAQAERCSAAVFAMSACPPALGAVSLVTSNPQHQKSCRTLSRLAVERLARGDVETLIISARWLEYFFAKPESYVEEPLALTSAQRQRVTQSVQRGLAEALAQITPHVRKVMLIGPVPQLRQNVTRCLLQAHPDDCSLSRQDFELRSQAPLRALRELAARFPNVEVIDVTDFFCNDQLCPVVRDGYPLYYDDDHPSATAARNLWDLIAQRSASAVPASRTSP